MTKHVKPSAPPIDAEQMAPYVECGWQAIPLHRPTDASTHHGKPRQDGKRPLDKEWTTKRYDSAKVIAQAVRDGRNVGIRLTPAQLVIDVDPRNGGDAGFAALCRDLRLDAGEWPHVVTGSGGSHYYLTKPEDVPVVDSLDQYPGVEFKSAGRQVVSAGSVHPDAMKLYEWDFLAPALSDVKPAPSSLIELIVRPAGAAVTEGGQHTQAEVAQMLDALDPIEFREQDRWFKLMAACHHASGGNAREEFLEWSSRDPEYADEGDKGRRWDSLHADKQGAITYRTLHDALIDAGREDAIPRTPAADDFPEDLTEEELARFGTSSGNPMEAVIERMNARYCAVIDGGGFKIFREDLDDTLDPPRRVFERMSRDAFRFYHENERIAVVGSSRDTTVADAWLRHPRRRQYPGIVMDPEGRHGDKLNLWRGWSVKPAPGDWSLMSGLIRDVLCAGSERSSAYVTKWIAYMLQNPGRMPEVAVAFRGDEGTGKGTLGRALMRIAGVHGLTVSSPGQFAGRFNAHLRDCVFLFADEAFWPGDKEAEGVLKQLVTEPSISYEAKGKDIVPGRNMIHVMMASNKDWLVPAGPTARRFAVFDVAPTRRGDRAFWDKLNRQLADGGLAGMVHDLMRMRLGDWQPKDDVPQTNALADQKERTLDPASQFWLGLVEKGELPHHSDDADHFVSMKEWDWNNTAAVVLDKAQRSRLVDEYEEFLKTNRIGYLRATHKAVLSAGQKAIGVEAKATPGGTERTWVLPALAEARRRFEKFIGSSGRFED